MAGDWIKMRNNLWDDPRVSACCDATEQSEATVIGGLYWLWSSADEHTVDGHLPGLSVSGIDRKTGIKGFGQALLACGWIADTEGGITILNFSEHNGASAKRRSADAQRKSNSRSVSASHADKTRTTRGQNAPECGPREEKRREEIQTPIPPCEQKPIEPSNGDGWDLKFEDLRNTGRIIQWITHTKLVPNTHGNQIRVLAASERAISAAKLGGEPVENRMAYFVSIVRDGNWKVITDADRDRGKMRHLEWTRKQHVSADPLGLSGMFSLPQD